MRYLVIGDSNSMHIYNFVKTVLLPMGFEVHLLTLSILPLRDEYRSFYIENNVTIHSVFEKNYKGLNKTDRIHRILNLLRKIWLMHDVPKVDICHVQSVYITSLMMVLLNRRKFKRLILSYWGGDIEDRSEFLVKTRAKCFEFCDAITVTVQQTLNEFRELYGNKYDEKLHICRFATNGLNCINELSKKVTREDCRAAYNIPKDKICITCGYSAYAEQHQEQCLEEIQKLPEELRKKIFAIVPMQYGRFDEAYIKRVEETKEKCDFDCVVLDEYVPFEMSAKLAIATDIYLHLRDTDAFSNALKEHIYAGSRVITGEWLKYIELEQMNAPFESISSISDLSSVLENKIKVFKISDEIDLFKPIYDMYSTENIINQWKSIINFASEQKRQEK